MKTTSALRLASSQPAILCSRLRVQHPSGKRSGSRLWGSGNFTRRGRRDWTIRTSSTSTTLRSSPRPLRIGRSGHGQRLRAEARTQSSPALGEARARGIGGDVEVRPRRRPTQELAYRGSAAKWAALSRPPPRPGNSGTPSYPALALRRARGWIVERAFARVRRGLAAPWVAGEHTLT